MTQAQGDSSHAQASHAKGLAQQLLNLLPMRKDNLPHQLLGASGLMVILAENTFHSFVQEDVTQYLQDKSRDAEDRIKLFRRAWGFNYEFVRYKRNIV